MPYTADKPPLPAGSEELTARIPGWGVDLDPADRPSFPRESREPTGAHWYFPERQAEHSPRERSTEHALLPPVFGTTCPLHGLSGVMRRRAYRHSEARARRWLMLLAADRVDATEAHLRSFAGRRPDNPVTQTGLKAEVSGHGWRSRVGRNRADVRHQALDPLIVAGPWVASGAAIVLGVRRLARR